MTIYQQILNLFEEDTEEYFNTIAISVFKQQAIHNPVYKQYLELINCSIDSINLYTDIPLLPISVYKNKVIKTHAWNEEKIFLSSGSNTQAVRSKHYVKSLAWYNGVSTRAFGFAGYGMNESVILGLLPSYIENGDSSLVHMIAHFQDASQTQLPANYLYDFDRLNDRILQELSSSSKKVVVFGVTYALLDFAEKYQIHDSKLELIFTGGMKNHRQELSHEEIVILLSKAFPSSSIRSEYGMTEMFSQAYSIASSLYQSSPTMRVLAKQLQDPFTDVKIGKTGILGIIDLANVDSCSFVLTEDLSIVRDERHFEVRGRMDQSDLRGCNLLYQSDYF